MVKKLQKIIKIYPSDCQITSYITFQPYSKHTVLLIFIFIVTIRHILIIWLLVPHYLSNKRQIWSKLLKQKIKVDKTVLSLKFKGRRRSISIQNVKIFTFFEEKKCTIYVMSQKIRIQIRYMEDLQPPQKQTILLDTFQQNCNRLLSMFMPNKPKMSGENIPQALQANSQVIPQAPQAPHAPQAPQAPQANSQAIPQESWIINDWLRWANTNLDQKYHYNFRTELERMFRYNQTKSFKYVPYELNEKILAEINSYSVEASRYVPNDNPIMCVLYSIYSKMSASKNILSHQKDSTLWKIGMWLEKNVTTYITSTVKNFRVTRNLQVSAPTLTSTEKDLNPKKKRILFPTEPLDKKDTITALLNYVFFANQAGLLWGDKINKQQFTEAIRMYSDDEIIAFAAKVAQAKYAYNKVASRQPVNSKDGVLPEFNDNENVAIIGDWGTGLRDSFDLLDQLVLQRQATIILHLGDVYYAGFPEQFARITNKIKELRKKVPTLRYYTIPGNHDYYTGGGPFYDHLVDCNEKPYQQQFAFFCLRNRGGTVQYIGLDTGYNGSGPIDQTANFWFDGTFIQQKELAWAKDRINQFNGQTILLTHHQLFSPYEPIIGGYTTFGVYNQQVNPLLSQQLFDIMNKVTVWFWGHEHRLACFIDYAYGVPAARMVGNSAFQVHHPDTYKVIYDKFNVLEKQNFRAVETDNGWFDHNAALVHYKEGLRQVRINYITMDSSYNKLSRSVDIIPKLNKINLPIKDDIRIEKRYNILDSSGLSYCVQLKQNYIWLNYVPTDFVFQHVTQKKPKPILIITPDSRFYIKMLASSNNLKSLYLRLNSSNYMQVTGDKTLAHIFKFIPAKGKDRIMFGEAITLFCETKNLQIGRYSNTTYYSVAAGSGTFLGPIKICRRD